jgi:hypothetical protein
MLGKKIDDNSLECSTFAVAFIVGIDVTYAIRIDSSFEYNDSSNNPSFLLVDKTIFIFVSNYGTYSSFATSSSDSKYFSFEFSSLETIVSFAFETTTIGFIISSSSCECKEESSNDDSTSVIVALVAHVVTFIVPFETTTSKVFLFINTPWFIPHPYIE